MLDCISDNSEHLLNDHCWYVCMFTFLSSFSPFSLFAEWYIILEYKSLSRRMKEHWNLAWCLFRYWSLNLQQHLSLSLKLYEVDHFKILGVPHFLKNIGDISYKFIKNQKFSVYTYCSDHFLKTLQVTCIKKQNVNIFSSFWVLWFLKFIVWQPFWFVSKATVCYSAILEVFLCFWSDTGHCPNKRKYQNNKRVLLCFDPHVWP